MCPFVRVSVCVQNTGFCQSADRGIKSHLATALVFSVMYANSSLCNAYVVVRKFSFQVYNRLFYCLQTELEKLNNLVWPEIRRLAEEQIQEYAKGNYIHSYVQPTTKFRLSSASLDSI